MLLLSPKPVSWEVPSITIGTIMTIPANKGICRLRRANEMKPKKPTSKPVHREHIGNVCPRIARLLSGRLWQKNAKPSCFFPTFRSRTGPALASQMNSKILLLTGADWGPIKTKTPSIHCYNFWCLTLSGSKIAKYRHYKSWLFSVQNSNGFRFDILVVWILLPRIVRHQPLLLELQRRFLDKLLLRGTWGVSRVLPETSF